MIGFRWKYFGYYTTSSVDDTSEEPNTVVTILLQKYL